MKHIPLPNGTFAIVDDADFDELNRYRWHPQRGGYAIRYHRVGGSTKVIWMHHCVIGRPPAGQITDHKNRNKLDNRSENLRFGSKSLNARNNAIDGGVYLFKGKWRIRLQVMNKTLCFGSFEDEAEARSVAALLKGALIYHELTKGDSSGL